MPVTFPLRSDLSTQQGAVIDWVRDGSGSLNLIAYAGTGKTSTLMEVAKVITGNGFMGSFNKPIADEFVSRLAAQRSYHVKGSTLHSAGNSAWRKVAPRVGKPDDSKMRSIARNLVSWDRKLAGAVVETVGYAKQACLGCEGVADFMEEKPWLDLIEYYDTEIPTGIKPGMLVEYCQKAYQQSLDACEVAWDFNDMLLAPLYFKAPFQKYDWIMIDEAQDTNAARRMLTMAMMHETTRVIAVGDPFQAIYRFAGADSNAMDLIAEKLNSTTLPLSVTYRCPRAVVDLAQEWVPDFEAAPTAPEGAVELVDHEQFLDGDFFKFDIDNDVVLCRNTRPLIGVASVLRKQNIPCVVEGQSGKVLKALAVKWGEDIKIGDWLILLGRYQAEEIDRYTKKNDLEKVEYVTDKCESIRDMAISVGEGKGVQDLVRHIDFLFGDSYKHALHLCTVHKSKGREWKRVFLVGRNRYMPSPWAKNEAELAQERNLAYVAVTRTKETLVEVDVPFKKRGEAEWWEE